MRNMFGAQKYRREDLKNRVVLATWFFVHGGTNVCSCAKKENMLYYKNTIISERRISHEQPHISLH